MLSNKFGGLHDLQMEEAYSSDGFSAGDFADLASGVVGACARPFGSKDAGSLVVGVFLLCKPLELNLYSSNV
jgi:hypothetical protein